MTAPDEVVTDMLHYPLMQAIFGRRSRRFGLGLEIASGPLAYRSSSPPEPLSEMEEALLIAAGTGVSGWNFGVPHGPDRPDSHAHYTVRFTGRTAPTAGGFGTPALIYTNDSGTYLTNTRDRNPDRVRELPEDAGDADRIMAVCRESTVRLSDRRLDLPAAPPHMLEPNLWMANAPGSTLFMPIGDASEELLGLLALAISNGNMIMDDDVGRPAGNLSPFVRSGLLDEGKKVPLSVAQQITYESNCAELAFMGHNMTLAMQAMGLGGLYFAGLNRWSIMGAFAEDGIQGLGFRFLRDERWTLPDPIGLDGHYEALCPPYFTDMHAAVETFVERKFGPGGAYDPGTPGPWKDSAAVRSSVGRYSDELVDCMAEVAQYIYDKHGRFPGTFTTIVLPGFVQAVHLDTGYYDEHFQPGAYLETHAEHMARWHG